jgi:hypothetical protein
MDVAQVAQGHNSAFVDTDGKAYLIYHTRTDDGTEGHYVKVHQLFVNENGWLVTAPYRYSGETLNKSGYSVSQVAGSYEVLMQKQSINYASLEYVSPVTINLGTDGKVTGDYTGTWSLTANSPYITVTLGGVDYKGVVIRQIIEGTDEDTMCFTLVGDKDSEMAVWGSKYLTGKRGIEMAIKKLTVASIAMEDLTLPTVGAQNVQISWKSSNPDVIATDGTLTVPEKETTVTLTATFTSNGVSESKTYDVQVPEAPKEDADEYVVARYYTGETIDLSKAEEGSFAIPNPFNSANTSGLEIYNGVAIEFDVTHTASDVTMLNTLFAFTDSGSGKLYFTEGSYLGYNVSGDWYDANILNYGLVTDYIGTKAKVRIDFLPTGYEVRVNGNLVYSNETVDSKDTEGTNSITGYNYVLKWLNESATTLNFGWGSWWEGAYQGTISNVVCYVKTIEKVDTSQYVYYQDYNKSDISEWTSANDQKDLKVANDGDSHSNYLKFEPTVDDNGNQLNSRGAICTFADNGKVSGKYTLDFDLKLTAGNNQTTEFAVTTDKLSYSSSNMNNGISNGYLFKLSATDSTTWAINDGDTFTIPKATWVHITVNTDTDAGKADVKITNGDTVIYSGTVTMKGAGTLNGFYIRGGRYKSITCVDNVAIKTTESVSQTTASDESSNTDNNSDGNTTGNSTTTDTTTTPSETETTSGSSSNNSNVSTSLTIGSGSGSGSSNTSGTTTGTDNNTTENTTGGTTDNSSSSDNSDNTSNAMNLVYQCGTSPDGTRYAYIVSGSAASGSVTIPSTYTADGNTYSVVAIEESAFQNSTGLVSITLPDTITYIGESAFSGCESLTSITIPASVTSIDQWAFNDCPSLTTVTFKSANTTIHNEAFWDCPNLTTVYASGTAKSGMESQVGLSNEDYKLIYIVIDNSSN